MNDLIRRSALIAAREKAIWVYENANIINTDAIRENLKPLLDVVVDAPAVDAVEVVRCKDCRFGSLWCDGSISCEKHTRETDYEKCDLWMEAEDFCSYGERRNGDD